MRVLLIYELVPDNTQLYVIDDPTIDEVNVLIGANGFLINCDESNDSMDKLNELLGEGQPWAFKQITKQQLPVSGPFDNVYWSGFAL